jgi:hypothetical protein
MAKADGYRIYKGKSVAYFHLSPAYTNKKNNKEYAPSITLEVARAIGDKVYDWPNKIQVKLGINDLGLIFGSKNGEFKLTHQWENRTTVIQMTAGKEYGWGLGVSVGTEGSDVKNNIFVPISDGEYEIVMELFRQSVTTLTGWYDGQFSQASDSEG